MTAGPGPVVDGVPIPSGAREAPVIVAGATTGGARSAEPGTIGEVRGAVAGTIAGTGPAVTAAAVAVRIDTSPDAMGAVVRAVPGPAVMMTEGAEAHTTGATSGAPVTAGMTGGGPPAPSARTATASAGPGTRGPVAAVMTAVGDPRGVRRATTAGAAQARAVEVPAGTPPGAAATVGVVVTGPGPGAPIARGAGPGRTTAETGVVTTIASAVTNASHPPV